MIMMILLTALKLLEASLPEGLWFVVPAGAPAPELIAGAIQLTRNR